MLIIGITGKLILKEEVLGFGDVKLFAAVGLITGPFGAAIVLIASSFLSCLCVVTGIIRKKIKRTDAIPFGPFIALSTALYLIFV